MGMLEFLKHFYEQKAEYQGIRKVKSLLVVSHIAQFRNRREIRPICQPAEYKV